MHRERGEAGRGNPSAHVGGSRREEKSAHTHAEASGYPFLPLSLYNPALLRCWNITTQIEKEEEEEGGGKT